MEDFRDDELKKWLAEEYEKEIDEMEEVLFRTEFFLMMEKRKKRQKAPTKTCGPTESRWRL